jgi:hypothetical protein
VQPVINRHASPGSRPADARAITVNLIPMTSPGPLRLVLAARAFAVGIDAVIVPGLLPGIRASFGVSNGVRSAGLVLRMHSSIRIARRDDRVRPAQAG